MVIMFNKLLFLYLIIKIVIHIIEKIYKNVFFHKSRFTLFYLNNCLILFSYKITVKTMPNIRTYKLSPFILNVKNNAAKIVSKITPVTYIINLTDKGAFEN